MTPGLFGPASYFRLKKLEKPISLSTRYASKLMAGGTDLLVNRNPETEQLIEISPTSLDYTNAGTASSGGRSSKSGWS